MNEPVHIRIAEASDARQIMAVINSAFKVAEDFFCFEDRITLEEVERLFTTGTFLVAEARARGDRVLVGCVYEIGRASCRERMWFSEGGGGDRGCKRYTKDDW